MARPRKIDDYIVHRIADLFRYADGPAISKGDTITLAEHRVLITDDKGIPHAIGELLCDLEPEHRPRILHRVADALTGKLARKRKSGKADDIAKIREAWLQAKAKLKGLYKGDNPTKSEVEHEYGDHLDRRSLPNHCPLRPDKRGKKKLPRLEVTRNRGKTHPLLYRVATLKNKRTRKR
jgi:hypothetical protein